MTHRMNEAFKSLRIICIDHLSAALKQNIMKRVKEVLEPKITTPYKGSEATYLDIKNQLLERFGPTIAEGYKPTENCAPFSVWAKAGFKIKRGEKSLRSVTFVESEDPQTGEVKKVRRTVSLFHRCQVELAEPVKQKHTV